jgi:hypothetical protein
MNWTRAIKNDPNAIDPKWYLNIHHIPLVIEPFPFESELLLKYQIAQAAEIVKYEHPIIKALIHRYPNNEYKNAYLV